MMGSWKIVAIGGILVLGLMAAVAVCQEPALPGPATPFLSPSPTPCPLAYYGYGFCRLGYTPYHLPYYTLHPPVYYSYPVPRPYGYSPFAYPPGTMTPEVAPPTPLMIRNPFVPQKSVQPASDKVVGGPLRIVNPYVAQTDVAGASQAPVARQATRGPQVIYPIAATEKL